MKRLLWWLLAGTRGGETRAMILRLLKQRPYNANQLTRELGVDYKTVRHHLRVLQKNRIIVARGERYGRLYFLSPQMEENIHVLEEIWSKIGKSKLKKGR
ncbi:MAG: winged helix-turn-helix transcriptional regulator [Euryarchaeota archaeon]|nr:winged helix-turn-helix transcriptional regulator [Euryarchaeota archaeon]